MNKDLKDYKVISVPTTMAEIKRQHKEHKVIKIIANKKVDVSFLSFCVRKYSKSLALVEYNDYVRDLYEEEAKPLTKEELKLLREVLCNNGD